MEALPGYREAYPCLDIFELQAAFWRDELVCTFVNERKFRVGQVAVLGTNETTVDLVYWLHRPPKTFSWEARIQLPIEPVPNPVYRDRFYWLCANCEQRRKKLYFKAEWKCADCHQLRFWSQLPPPDVVEFERKQERRQELQAWIGAGRRSRMRHGTYKALRAELSEVEQWLKAADERSACSDHRHFVTGQWQRPENVDDLWLTRYAIRGGKIVPIQNL